MTNKQITLLIKETVANAVGEIFNDPDIGIDWENENPFLSERDKNAPFLKDCDINL